MRCHPSILRNDPSLLPFTITLKSIFLSTEPAQCAQSPSSLPRTPNSLPQTERAFTQFPTLIVVPLAAQLPLHSQERTRSSNKTAPLASKSHARSSPHTRTYLTNEQSLSQEKHTDQSLSCPLFTSPHHSIPLLPPPPFTPERAPTTRANTSH